VPIPYFLLFLCFRKVTQQIFSELDETKAKHLEIYRSFQRTEEEMEWGHEGPTQQAARPKAWPRPLCVWPPRSTSDDAPSPIKTPRREKPKHQITFPETYRSVTAVEDKFRGTKVFVPAPCRDREVPPDRSPSPLLSPMMRRE
jgi:hypothetical protein